MRLLIFPLLIATMVHCAINVRPVHAQDVQKEKLTKAKIQEQLNAYLNETNDTAKLWRSVKLGVLAKDNNENLMMALDHMLFVEIDEKRIEQLLLTLDAADFEDRENASSELIAFGPGVLPFINKAVKSEDISLEKRSRLLTIAKEVQSTEINKDQYDRYSRLFAIIVQTPLDESSRLRLERFYNEKKYTQVLHTLVIDAFRAYWLDNMKSRIELINSNYFMAFNQEQIEAENAYIKEKLMPRIPQTAEALLEFNEYLIESYQQFKVIEKDLKLGQKPDISDAGKKKAVDHLARLFITVQNVADAEAILPENAELRSVISKKIETEITEEALNALAIWNDRVADWRIMSSESYPLLLKQYSVDAAALLLTFESASDEDPVPEFKKTIIDKYADKAGKLMYDAKRMELMLSGWQTLVEDPVTAEVDPRIVGQWVFRDGQILSTVGELNVWQSWKVMPASYDVYIEFNRSKGDGGIMIGLPMEGRAQPAGLNLGGWGGQFSGLEWIDRKQANENETTRDPDFANDQNVSIMVQARMSSLDDEDQITFNVLKDTKPYISWTGMTAQIMKHSIWQTQEPAAPIIGVHQSVVDFRYIMYRPAIDWIRMQEKVSE